MNCSTTSLEIPPDSVVVEMKFSEVMNSLLKYPEGLPGLVLGYILHMAGVLTHQNVFMILIFECLCMGYQIANVPSFSNNNARSGTWVVCLIAIGEDCQVY